MKTLIVALALALVLAGPARAQEYSVAAGFVFDSTSCKLTSGTGAASGGNNCDVYVKSDGVIYVKTGGTWVALGTSIPYPGAGIPLSTGSAWSTSITNNSANWNTAYGWGNHAGLYLGVSATAADSHLLDGAHGSAYSPVAGSSSLVTVGALDAGSITGNFGAIDVGADGISGGAISGTTGAFSGNVAVTKASPVLSAISNAADTVDDDATLALSANNESGWNNIRTYGTNGSPGGLIIKKHGGINSLVMAGATGFIGLGTFAPDRMLEINSATGENLRLTYNDSNGSAATYADFSMSSGGNLTIAPTGGLSLHTTVTPTHSDTFDLGSASLFWRQGYLSQLNAVLFAKETISLFGGWQMVTKNAGTFAAAVGSGDTTINFGTAMTTGQFVLVRAADTGGSIVAEYIQVGSNVSGTTYNVTRNLSGAGAKNWAQGVPFAVRGVNGDGWVELQAYDAPRMSVFTQGEHYNDATELVRVGELGGFLSIAAGKYGLGIGDASAYLTYYDGTLAVKGSVTASTGAIGGWAIGATSLTDAAGTVGMSSAVTGGDDIRFWAGHATPASAPFIVTEAGALTASSATITGTVNATAGYFGSGSTKVAINSDGLDVGSAGRILGGQTAYNTGTGFWLGYSGAYKLSIGHDDGNRLTWDGTDLTLVSKYLTIGSSGPSIAITTGAEAARSYGFSTAMGGSLGLFAYENGTTDRQLSIRSILSGAAVSTTIGLLAQNSTNGYQASVTAVAQGNLAPVVYVAGDTQVGGDFAIYTGAANGAGTGNFYAAGLAGFGVAKAAGVAVNIKGTGATSGTTGLYIADSNNVATFYVLNDGQAYVKSTLYAAAYYAGAVAGVDCNAGTVAMAATKGIVTGCTSPDALFEMTSYSTKLLSLEQRITDLEALLARRHP